ncbi:hypothetical protein HY792_03020 [Candidatus Desantisbacteria bacterium]|nr:hypothetical protein [Candidatus Desantisbacteria bacterium]
MTRISNKSVNALIVHPDIPGVLYGLGYDGYKFGVDGIVKSIDDGKSWRKANTGLPISTLPSDYLLFVKTPLSWIQLITKGFILTIYPMASTAVQTPIIIQYLVQLIKQP